MLNNRPSLGRSVGWLVLLGVAALASLLMVRSSRQSVARDQRAIDEIVRKSRELTASLEKTRAETRALIDPLTELLEMDRKLIAAGLRPLSGQEFSDRLATANQFLVAKGLEEYIDPCRQRAEVVKHWLYEGHRAPALELPGWDQPCLSADSPPPPP